MSGPLVRDEAAQQLTEYAASKEYGSRGIITNTGGNPIANHDSSVTIGLRGPTLIEDYAMFDQLTHWTHERISERVVHAKGSGAFGYFECTNDISQYTVARIFTSVGKKTPLAARFSTVIYERGSPDTRRDPRGFAVKYYTEDGIYDMVGNNTPIFFTRDVTAFISFIRSQKRNPVTYLPDWDQYWDFISLRPECFHQTIYEHGDRGTPDGFRHMHGFSSHTYMLINADRQITYCKFHYRTNQGVRNLTAQRALQLEGQDPDYSIRDLYNAIHRGEYPSWNLYIQVCTPQQAAELPFNLFDVSKVLPQKDFPLIPVGRMTLNRNPSNYIAEIEQLAFNPAHFIPGIAATPDRMLQARLIAYADTQRHRLGVNYLQLPVNAPHYVKNYMRDGGQVINNQNGAPVYHPNSFNGPEVDPRIAQLFPDRRLCDKIVQIDSIVEDNYQQPGVLYREVFNEQQRQTCANNIAFTLRRCTERVIERTIMELTKIDDDLGRRVSRIVNQAVNPTAQV
ncbi:catalase-like [Agrilus planipennis]|uniref:Catalase-like n=1 Tax=Agrilus planipennis TaxID=224129 RepID=A0A1W4WQU4_AGRPL|nr:catalase-like [Agrilus planipennis]